MLREARLRALLTQRGLATAARVPQSTVAKIETGTITPRVDTLDRLLEACGHGLESLPRPGIGVDLTLIDEQLRRSPEERLRAAASAARALDRLLRATRSA